MEETMTLWTIHLLAIPLLMIGSFAAGMWYDKNIRRLGTIKKQYSSGGAVTKKDYLDIKRAKKDGKTKVMP